mgnify:CR=1 FL=1
MQLRLLLLVTDIRRSIDRVQLGLTTYHVCEPELKEEFDEAVYDEQVGMMEMVLDVDDIVDEMSAIRDEYCKYL